MQIITTVVCCCILQTTELISADILECLLIVSASHTSCDDSSSLHQQFTDRVCAALSKQLMRSVLDCSTADSQDPTKVIQYVSTQPAVQFLTYYIGSQYSQSISKSPRDGLKVNCCCLVDWQSWHFVDHLIYMKILRFTIVDLFRFRYLIDGTGCSTLKCILKFGTRVSLPSSIQHHTGETNLVFEAAAL